MKSLMTPNSSVLFSLNHPSRSFKNARGYKIISIWLNILGAQAKENYDKLYGACFQDSLAEVNKDLIWDRMDGKKMSSVILKSPGDILDKNDWPRQFQWFKENLEMFTKFFKPKIANL